MAGQQAITQPRAAKWITAKMCSDMRRRVRAGETRRSIASDLGCSESRVYLYTKGIRRPTDWTASLQDALRNRALRLERFNVRCNRLLGVSAPW